MKDTNELILVSAAVLPKVYLKVVEAKTLLSEGKATTINNAALAVGISRSAFYKYKDYVFPISKMSGSQIFTLSFIVCDHPGILSDILKEFACSMANILTINQNIPVNNTANITVSFKLDGNITILMENLKSVNGVKKIDVIAKE